MSDSDIETEKQEGGIEVTILDAGNLPLLLDPSKQACSAHGCDIDFQCSGGFLCDTHYIGI